jgi:NhaA family Na+:H+ antiporter
MVGVVAGLVIGKPIGVLAASWISVRLGLAALPRGVSWRGVLLVGCVAGIGFTMAIFVAGLAFPEGAGSSPGSGLLGAAKLAVLIASTASAGVAVLAGRVLLPPAPEPDVAATTPDEAEMSSDY